MSTHTLSLNTSSCIPCNIQYTLPVPSCIQPLIPSLPPSLSYHQQHTLIHPLIPPPTPSVPILHPTGAEEIDSFLNVLDERADQDARNLLLIPLYSSLPYDVQMRAFQPTPVGSRKIIATTNIAETSVTIEGIVTINTCPTL